jgi:hypothetical protein
MQRRDLLKGSIVGLGAGLLRSDGPEPAHASTLPSGSPAAPEQSRQFSHSIREYMSRQAQKITDAALADYPDAATFRRLIPERRRQYLEMMGFPDFPTYAERTPLNVKVTGVVEHPRYRIEKLYYESLPKGHTTLKW